jgi:hypothetical protein
MLDGDNLARMFVNGFVNGAKTPTCEQRKRNLVSGILAGSAGASISTHFPIPPSPGNGSPYRPPWLRK